MGAVHINITYLPSGEFSCWGLLLAQRPENFCAVVPICVWTNASFVTSSTRCVPVKNCRCDIVISRRNILSSRHYSYFLSTPRDFPRSHFLFASLAPRCAAETGKEKEREKEQRANSRKYGNATRYALEFTGDDIHAFSPRLHISSLFFSTFCQITDFCRCQVLRFMCIQLPQR